MRDGFLRLNYFAGQRLEATDLELGQGYHQKKKKLHNRTFHGYGIVEGHHPIAPPPEDATERVQKLDPDAVGGFRVVARKGDYTMRVLPGYAIDGNGNDIVLYDEMELSVDPLSYRMPQDVFVVAKYLDEPIKFTVNIANPRFKGHRRTLETSQIEISTATPDPEEGVELARVRLTEDVKEIKDAIDPRNPKAGDIDMRFVPRAGLAGSGLSAAMRYRFRAQLRMMRNLFTILSLKFAIHAARDVRNAIVDAQMLTELNQVRTLEDIVRVMRILVSLEEEIMEETYRRYPVMSDWKDFQAMKRGVDAMSHMLKTPKHTPDEFRSLMGYQEKASESLSKFSREPVPESTETDLVLKGTLQSLSHDIDALRAAPPPKAAAKPKPKKEEPKKQADAGAKALSWDELQSFSGELPDKVFLDGKNFSRKDAIDLVDKKSEQAHKFTMEGYKDKWSTNQTYAYPDGKKVAAKGQAHVGGYSQWEFQNLEPGKELVISKRIDYAYGGLVTGIYADGEMVGEWKIEGQDRKARWRNWLFKIPGSFVKSDKVTIKQTSIDADREINMFKLWCYQAAEA